MHDVLGRPIGPPLPLATILQSFPSGSIVSTNGGDFPLDDAMIERARGIAGLFRLNPNNDAIHFDGDTRPWINVNPPE